MLVGLTLPGSIRPIAQSDEMMGKLAKNEIEWVNPYNNRRMRRANVDWLSKEDWSHAITLNINRQIHRSFGKCVIKADIGERGVRNG